MSVAMFYPVCRHAQHTLFPCPDFYNVVVVVQELGYDRTNVGVLGAKQQKAHFP